MNATASILVHAPLKDVFKTILDPIEYRLTDPRVSELVVVAGGKRDAWLRVRAYAFSPWLESAAITRVRIGPRGRLEFKLKPKTLSLPSRLILGGFRGVLVLEAVAGGTRVTRSEVLVLRDNPLGRLAARFGGNWLQTYLDNITMPRLKQVIEAKHRHPEPGSSYGAGEIRARR